MFKRFFPKSPDPVINTSAENSPARLGHLNAVIDYINAVPPGSGITSVTGDIVDNTDPLNPIIGIATDGTLLGTGSTEDKIRLAVLYSSGTWVPTIDNELVIFQSGYYSVIGDIVTASFTGTFTLEVGFSTADFNFTLPIDPTYNFDSLYDVVGLINLHNTNSQIIQQRINSNVGAMTCNARVRVNAAGSFSVQIQYNTNN